MRPRTYLVLLVSGRSDDRWQTIDDGDINQVVRTAKLRMAVDHAGTCRIHQLHPIQFTPLFSAAHQIVITASAMPPIALTATTNSGGACHTVKSTNPTSATPKSPGAMTEVVHTGL